MPVGVLATAEGHHALWHVERMDRRMEEFEGAVTESPYLQEGGAQWPGLAVKWMDSASVLQKVIGIASGSSFDCGAVSEAAEIGEAAIEEMSAETVAHE